MSGGRDARLAQAVAEISRLTNECIPRASRWTHRKGGRYLALRLGLVEATLDIVVIYVSEDPAGVTWTRPVSEFLDGRFTRTPDA